MARTGGTRRRLYRPARVGRADRTAFPSAARRDGRASDRRRSAFARRCCAYRRGRVRYSTRRSASGRRPGSLVRGRTGGLGCAARRAMARSALSGPRACALSSARARPDDWSRDACAGGSRTAVRQCLLGAPGRQRMFSRWRRARSARDRHLRAGRTSRLARSPERRRARCAIDRGTDPQRGHVGRPALPARAGAPAPRARGRTGRRDGPRVDAPPGGRTAVAHRSSGDAPGRRLSCARDVHCPGRRSRARQRGGRGHAACGVPHRRPRQRSRGQDAAAPASIERAARSVGAGAGGIAHPRSAGGAAR